MKLLGFYLLSFLSVTILFQHVNCKGSHDDFLREQLRHIFPESPRHSESGWSSWSSWRRERECQDGSCVGNNTQTTDNPCPDPRNKRIVSRKNILQLK